MTDERDPAEVILSGALRRLANAAPQPRPDRLEAVVAGVRRRRQARMTTSALTAAAFVVAAAVGVHIWSTTASDTTVGPGPILPPVSASPDAAASSSSSLTSQVPVASASAAGVPVLAPTAAAPTPTAKGLVATVTTPASVVDGDPAKVTMTVKNKGSVTTHGGSFTVVNAYAQDGGQGAGFEFSGYSSSCVPTAGKLVCDVGTLKPGQSVSFFQAITATGAATQIIFDVSWNYKATGATAVSTPFHRVVELRAGVPSSELSTPPSSVLPTPPSSSPPPVSGSPKASTS